ncbi:MAG TPA: 2Fe-2S iron-sulfur cluster-binding protein, partial [Candidatus Eisenbacteria bacterium]
MTPAPAPAPATAAREAVLRVWRGDASGGREVEYKVPVEPGMVVLDAIHWIQGHLASDLAVRWNCKAAKCGSCSAEVNGKPSLMCKSRLDRMPPGEPITVRPMRTFPLLRDLVTDVSWNYEVNRRIPPFKPRPGAEWRWKQTDIDRVQEFRMCIEC